MVSFFNETLFNKLTNGKMVIVYDDVVTNIGSFVGIADKVTPQTVNQMIKIGKGLIYVCITEERASQLKLPLMVGANSSKSLTVSVDYKETTTGISAFERSDTIKAFTDDLVQPGDFRRPGHVFPLLGKDKGLLQRVGIAEAAIALSRMAAATPIAYICEILNDTGDIATKEEIIQIAKAYDLNIVLMSDLIALKRNELIGSFTGQVIQGRETRRKIGFPTAHLLVEMVKPLEHGVYGVTVVFNQIKYYGVMNVGNRPTFNKESNEIHYEVHLLKFNNMAIYGKTIKVDVNFFVRPEISFPTVDQLVYQIKKDIEHVEDRFGLFNKRIRIR
jgi:3,4-dihydroxy-2-butanone 4-phosphate synthase